MRNCKRYGVKFENADNVSMEQAVKLMKYMTSQLYTHEETIDRVARAMEGDFIVNYPDEDYALEFIMNMPAGIRCKIVKNNV